MIVINYTNYNIWYDGNGHSHIRTSLVGPSLTIPIIDGYLMIGNWQQIVLMEMDMRPGNAQLSL